MSGAREGGASLVLVVDDNEPGRYGKSRTLRTAGFQVAEAATGAEALRLIAERHPRLVLLDINLPDMDGWEICRRVKSNPATASVVILQMSATYVREEDTVRALEGGADACLTEPVERLVLVATVRALLRAREAEDAVRAALAREQAARASAEMANRTKDEFLATLSHELRSPLGTILTWVTLLRAGRVEGEQIARAFEVIERNTRLQVKLIEDLLDVSRIISGKMRLELGLVELAVVVEAALDSVRPAALAKGIRLETVVDPRVGPVSGDAARLQQVVWNLLSNAVKFTPRNGRVGVRVKSEDSQAHIQITDTGRGIESVFLPHIFERFRQADASTTRTEGGLGLGLAIVRHLVELHGGTVEAYSPGSGQGATFTVKLPLPAVRTMLAADAPGPPGQWRIAPAPMANLAGLRVLVLDDEPDAREAISAVLTGCGARVTAAATVQEALRALLADTDVVVSDVAMPEEDGYRFIQEVRGRPATEGGRIPALALTAHASGPEQQRILVAGFDAYMSKPVEATELACAVARLAGRPAR
ncbi:MAG TPA: response regulator [Candidatus Binatia bacterium]|nr:response regulator [Candidatus Binatia bacterium]